MRVPGIGPKDGSFIIVGEAPGFEEEKQGKPFVGSSGRLLTEMLTNVGINRNDCYITNVVKERPPQNDFSTFYKEKSRKTPSEKLERAIMVLQSEIASCSAKVIITLGNEALRAVTGKSGISKWRGSPLKALGKIVLPSYHPAAILRMYNFRAISELDFKKALALQSKPFLVDDAAAYRFEVDPPFDKVMERLREIKKGKKRFAFDIETTSDLVRCLSLAWDSYKAICIPFIINEKRVNLPTHFLEVPSSQTLQNAWQEEQEFEILTLLKEIFEDEGIEKIAQNFPFDASIIERNFGIKTNGLWMDTMVAMHCCYSELPKSLDFLNSIFTYTPYYGNYEASNDWSTWVYNCYDSAVTFQVASKLFTELSDFSQWDFYKNHAEPGMLALTRAGHCGVLVDLDLRKELLTKMEEKLRLTKERLNVITGRDINPNSPKQMEELLYKDLGLPAQKNRKTGKVTANEEAIETLSGKYEHVKPLLDLILDYRGCVKAIGTFLTSTLDNRQRMLTQLNATGTKTGRVSASKTIFGLGGNMQQVPKSNDDAGGLRRIFCAPPGYKLIKADLSQAEARATAWLSEDHDLIERFMDPTFDVHSFNASLIYKIKEGEVTRGVLPDGTMSQREKVKRVVHGANYGIKALTCSKITGLPYIEVKHALDAYISSKPALQLWWRNLRETVVSLRKLITPLGRQRIFFDRLDENTFRSAYAFLPQSLVADMILRAFTKLDKTLPEGARLELQVHDEVVVECRDDLVDKVALMVKQCLELPVIFPQVSYPLIIPAEVSVGQNWYEQEDVSFESN